MALVEGTRISAYKSRRCLNPSSKRSPTRPGGRFAMLSTMEHPPDMSDFKMETINDGGGWGLIVGIPLIGLMVAGFIYLVVLMFAGSTG